ncbi:MFS transporter [Kitasatospora sp. CB02891]|nr:MFS transporter [Kitasatospora sp. CB02891]
MEKTVDESQGSAAEVATAEAPQSSDSGTGVRKRGGVFAQRDFRLLWFGETSSSFGNGIATVSLPLIAVVALHAGPMAVGVLAAAVWLPWLIVGLPVGAWVDRLPRRPVMITCNIVSTVLFASVPIAWWLDVLTIGHLLVVAMVTGTASVFFSTAYHVYLPSIVAEDDLMEANVKLQGAESVMEVVGPGAGGLIAQWAGAVIGLLTNAVTFLISTVCLLLIRSREPEPTEPEREDSLRQQIAEGLRFTVRDPYLLPIVMYGALANLALDGYQAVQIIFLIRTVGADPAVVGGLIAAAGIGGVLGAMIAKPIGDRFGTARGMLICQLGAAPFALLMPLTTPGVGLVFFAIGSMAPMVGVVASNAFLNSFRQRYCPPNILGRVVATTMFLNYSTVPLGALLGGFLGSVIGTRPTMWIMTILLVLFGLILLAGPLRRVRDFPTEPRADLVAA